MGERENNAMEAMKRMFGAVPEEEEKQDTREMIVESIEDGERELVRNKKKVEALKKLLDRFDNGSAKEYDKQLDATRELKKTFDKEDEGIEEERKRVRRAKKTGHGIQNVVVTGFDVPPVGMV